MLVLAAAAAAVEVAEVTLAVTWLVVDGGGGVLDGGAMAVSVAVQWRSLWWRW